MLLARDRLLDDLKKNMTRSQEFMKLYADKNRRHMELEEGDLVLVKLQPYRQHFVALRRHQKLGLRYFGPFRIIKKLSDVAYKLQLPEEAKIHNVFHVFVLKKFKGEHQGHYLSLPLKIVPEEPTMEPYAILRSRTVLHQGKKMKQILVQWGPNQGAATTWETSAEFLKNYPSFNLEGKVEAKEEGNVREQNINNNINEDMSPNNEISHHYETNRFVTQRGQVVENP